MQSFKTRLKNRGYPNKLSGKFLSEVTFMDRERSLENKDNGTQKKILPFVTHYHPALPSLKNMLMAKWHLIQTQPHLSEVFKEPYHCTKQNCFLLLNLGRHLLCGEKNNNDVVNPYYHIAKESR